MPSSDLPSVTLVLWDVQTGNSTLLSRDETMPSELVPGVTFASRPDQESEFPEDVRESRFFRGEADELMIARTHLVYFGADTYLARPRFDCSGGKALLRAKHMNVELMDMDLTDCSAVMVTSGIAIGAPCVLVEVGALRVKDLDVAGGTMPIFTTRESDFVFVADTSFRNVAVLESELGPQSAVEVTTNATSTMTGHVAMLRNLFDNSEAGLLIMPGRGIGTIFPAPANVSLGVQDLAVTIVGNQVFSSAYFAMQLFTGGRSILWTMHDNLFAGIVYDYVSAILLVSIDVYGASNVETDNIHLVTERNRFLNITLHSPNPLLGWAPSFLDTSPRRPFSASVVSRGDIFYRVRNIPSGVPQSDSDFPPVALSSSGGVVFLNMPPNQRQVDHCDSPGKPCQPKWLYSNEIVVEDVLFESCDVQPTRSDTLTSGGAMFVRDGHVIIRRGVFRNNRAFSTGGAIYLDFESTKLTIEDSIIDSNKLVGQGSLGSQIFSRSQGAVTISNSSIHMHTALAEIFAADMLCDLRGRSSFIPLNGTVFTCPPGYRAVNQSGSVQLTPLPSDPYAPWNAMYSSAVSFGCAPCPSGTYSLDTSSVRYDSSRPFGPAVIHSSLCRPCPFGVSCQGASSVRVLFAYWPYVDDTASGPQLRVVPCPRSYCCPPSKAGCSLSSVCSGNREGRLCGRCRAGFTAVLGSPACRHVDKCTDGWWFWIVVLVIALAFTWWLLWAAWYGEDSGLLKSVFFFYQVLDVVMVHQSSAFVLALSSIFNLRVIGKQNEDDDHLGGSKPRAVSGSAGVCPFEMSTEGTLAFQVAYPLVIFIAVLLVYAAYRTLVRMGWIEFRTPVPLRSKPPLDSRIDDSDSAAASSDASDGGYVALADDPEDSEDASSTYSLIPISLVHIVKRILQRRISPSPSLPGALTVLALIGYASVLKLCASLMHCVEAEDGKRVLFLAGDVECDSHAWYWVSLVVLIVFLLPFPLCIWYFRHALHLHIPTLTAAFSDAMPAWDSVLLTRRLVLVLLATFITDPFARLLAVTIACVVQLMLHVVLHPFRSPTVNRFETLSLFTLATISMVSIRSSVLVSNGLEGDASLTDRLDALQVALALLPLAGAVCVIFLRAYHIVSRKLRLRSPPSSS